MKKSTLLKLSVAIGLIALCAPVLTSCDTDDGWYPYPPNGWNNDFYDSRLDGYWQLVRVNSMPITGRDTNWLFFNGSGRGVYYYYLNGRPYSELTAYWCQRSGGVSRYQINLQYEGSGQSATMSYWFEDNDTLWMQWANQSGVQTYIYSYVGRAPW